MRRLINRVTTCLLLAVAITVLEGRQAKAPDEAAVDKVFGKWTPMTPGCAVGVSEGGRVVLQKAYGMADLEHDVPNSADTIFEAGSVSKQFTAAAVLLLAREGKLSLDDPVRKYIPELPDYGDPLLIRHMLQHTSGLRDWGEIEGVAGWPRTTRIYTQAHVLEIVSRQRALNFEPGTYWSYSNTGYNLAAIIVSRVSGQPFAEFCRLRIFEPLGMTHTSWRDDFRRIVKGRATAYEAVKNGYEQDMPFENVYGNGGLLTTVGDLLRWNENAVDRKVGDAEFLRVELQPGHFNDGKQHDYAMGLYIGTFAGVPEVSHSGSTAGYRAFLTRLPRQHLSVAVLCNASNATAERYAHAVAAMYLGDAPGPAEATLEGAKPGLDRVPSPTIAAWAGLYRNLLTGTPLTFGYKDAQFALENSGAPPIKLSLLTGSTFAATNGGRQYEFGAAGRLIVANPNGTSEAYQRIDPWKPASEELKVFAGTYTSDEAETEMKIVASGTELKLTRRPDTTLALRPVYRDAFMAEGLGLVRFRRDMSGRVNGLSVTLGRVWDLRFDRRQ